MSQETIQIGLEPDEALVLHALLTRWIDGAGPTPGDSCFESPAECAALHALLALFETSQDAPLSAGHARLLDEARARLAPRWDGRNLRD